MDKQKILEELIVNRKIERPIIKKRHVIYLTFTLTLSLIFLVWLCLTTKLNKLNKIYIFIILAVFFFEVYLRLFLIQIIKIYQCYAQEDVRRRCKCLPSCSEYTLISLSKIFPLVFAIVKIVKRLFYTCNGGKYILDYPLKKYEQIYFLKYIEKNKKR